jgi:hypothetical protein
MLHMGSNAGPSVPNNIPVPEEKSRGEGAVKIFFILFHV